MTWNFIIEYAEVWAPLLPIGIGSTRRSTHQALRWVFYGMVAMWSINLLIVIGYVYAEDAPRWLYPNNYLYNVQSIVRFGFFTSFFKSLESPGSRAYLLWLGIALGLVVLVNFLFFEKFIEEQSFSSRLLSLEAAALAALCVRYIIRRVKAPDSRSDFDAVLTVVAGLGIYVTVNFFIFLFYASLIEKEQFEQALLIWNVHNVAFIVLCFFTARAFLMPDDK